MNRSFKKIATLILAAGMILFASTGFAAPQGGEVVAGSARIRQQDKATIINQSSDRAIINWKSFDIGKQESVRHDMPSAQSAALHRVVGGGGASQIAGSLQSNGNIYLVNPAGVTIHKGARVQTNSFTATSRDISNENFMKGNMVFDKPGRPDAKIVNEGNITVNENGLAALVGPTVRNDGVIAGKLAKVALASGDSTYKLDTHGDELITFTVNEKAVNTLYAPDGTPLSAPEAKNAGTIKTEGGMVVLTASQLDGIVGQVVNTGHIEAGGISLKGRGDRVDVANTGALNASNATGNGGSVRLTGEAKVTAAGVIEAKGSSKGGKVVATGREVAVAANTKVDASGSQGGGIILIGGNYQGQGPERNAEKTSVAATAEIKADAEVKGDGGQVVVWSDGETTFDGAISARGGSEGGDGGSVETSGKVLKIGDAGGVNTSALNGSFGTWLLDPTDFVVAADGGDVTGAALSRNLELGNVIIKSSDGGSGTNGNIYINDEIYWTTPTKLTLAAYRSIYINEQITATNDTAGLELTFSTGTRYPIHEFLFEYGSYEGPCAGVYIRSRINMPGSNPTLIIDGRKYKIINTLIDMQNINNNIGGYYALGSDIDATETMNWNNGLGFQPIGTVGKGFQGAFNGLGHKITNLTINRPGSDYVGLFGYIKGAHIYNIGLDSINIIGKEYVGSIVGRAQDSCRVYSSYSTGCVTGYKHVGGFIGAIYYHAGIGHSFTTCDVKMLNQDSSIFGGFTSEIVGSYYNNIFDSYSIGAVDAVRNSGGFVGVVNGADMWAIYYNGDTAGVDDNYATRLTTADMMQRVTYPASSWGNWWFFDDGNSYPVQKIFSAPSRNPYLVNNNPNPGGNDPQNPANPNGGSQNGGRAENTGENASGTTVTPGRNPISPFASADGWYRPERPNYDPFVSTYYEILSTARDIDENIKILSDKNIKKTIIEGTFVASGELTNRIFDWTKNLKNALVSGPAGPLIQATWNAWNAKDIDKSISKTNAWNLAIGRGLLFATFESLVDNYIIEYNNAVHNYNNNLLTKNEFLYQSLTFLKWAEMCMVAANNLVRNTFVDQSVMDSLITKIVCDRIITEVNSSINKNILGPTAKSNASKIEDAMIKLGLAESDLLDEGFKNTINNMLAQDQKIMTKEIGLSIGKTVSSKLSMLGNFGADLIFDYYIGDDVIAEMGLVEKKYNDYMSNIGIPYNTDLADVNTSAKKNFSNIYDQRPQGSPIREFLDEFLPEAQTTIDTASRAIVTVSRERFSPDTFPSQSLEIGLSIFNKRQ